MLPFAMILIQKSTQFISNLLEKIEFEIIEGEIIEGEGYSI